MVVVGPTHTRGDTGFFVEGGNLLFAGDAVMTRRSQGWSADDADFAIP